MNRWRGEITGAGLPAAALAKAGGKGAGYRVLLTIVIICTFFLLPFPAQARRIKLPYSPLLEKLAACIPKVEVSLWNAADPNFFRDNWDTLKGGIRINFSNGSFLEVRRTEEQLIAQLIGMPSSVEWVLFDAIRDSLNEISVIEHEIPVTFYNFYDLEVRREALEAYSILGISADYFEIIVQDMLIGGSGSGLAVLSENDLSTDTEITLEFVDEIKNAIESAISHDLFDISWLNLDKKGLGALLEEAESVIPRLEHAFMGPDYLLDRSSRELNMLRLQLMRSAWLLKQPWGDLAYRILHREYIKPLIRISVEDKS